MVANGEENSIILDSDGYPDQLAPNRVFDVVPEGELSPSRFSPLPS